MISIIVPNYNHLKFLPQRMESILAQTDKDYEIILLDDCSFDGSREWLESMRDCPYVKHVVINENNSGSPFKQWRKGIELAEGEFIWIAESDDFCDPELLETLLTPFDSNPELVLSFCRSMLVDADGEDIGFHHLQTDWNEPRVFPGSDFVHEYLSKDNVVVNASGALFRRSAALKADPGYTDYRMVGDWLFWAELCMQGEVAYSPAPLNKFRQHINGLTISTDGSTRTALEHIRLFGKLQSLGLTSKADAYKRYFLSYYQIVYRGHDVLSPEQQAELDSAIPSSVKALAFIKYLKRSIINGASLRSRLIRKPGLLLCCIGKEENRYAREFVQWYRDLGFSKIVIYDNNLPDGERFETVLSDFIADGFVEIIDFRGRSVVQLTAYEDCYRRYGSKYGWMAFFDMDEFLEIDGCSSAPEYFSSDMFRHFDMVHINWQCYGDNGNLRYEDRPLRERFPIPLDPPDKINDHIKSVVRGGLGKLSWTLTPHTPSPCYLRCANASGHPCDAGSPFSKCDISVARLRHHFIKSTEEFRDKIIRGYPDHVVTSDNYKPLVLTYFKYCSRTPEKERTLTF